MILRFLETVVRRVKDIALGAYAHQDLPFEKLVDALQPGRDLSRQPICQVAFALQDVSLDQMSLPGIAVERFAEDTTSARFDLELSMTESGGTLVGPLSYATDLFDAATAERLARQFVRLLHGVAANPQERDLAAAAALRRAAPTDVGRVECYGGCDAARWLPACPVRPSSGAHATRTRRHPSGPGDKLRGA